MAWYRAGTAAFTNGNATVTGTGTAWVANATIGEALVAPDGRAYEITAIASDTSLTISPAYLGSTASAQSYAIAPIRGRIADLVAETSSLLASFASVRDGIGSGLFPNGTVSTPALRASADQDTGLFFPAANTLGAVTGGVQRVTIDGSGAVGIGTTAPATALHLANGNFRLSNGATFTTAASLIREINAASGSSNQFVTSAIGFSTGDFSDAGVLTFSTANNAATPTERMRISQTGSVGIGTSSPVNNSGYGGLTLNGSSGAILSMSQGGTETFRLKNATGYSFINTTGATPLLLGTNSTEGARIDTSGSLLISKSAENDTDVGVVLAGGATGQKGAITSTLAASTSGAQTLKVYSTGASAYRFYVDMAGSVFATSTTISAISDIRLKENVRDLDAGLDTILALKPRRFDWKEGKGKDIRDDMGFIAQEVEEVLPSLIGGWKAGEGEPDDLKSVKAGDLIPVLVKAIQELTARVAQLEGN